MNFQAAKAVILDSPPYQVLDPPGVTRRIDGGKANQLTRIPAYDFSQASISGGIVTIEDGKNDGFIYACCPRPPEVWFNARLGVPGSAKTISFASMTMTINNHSRYSSRNRIIVSTPRKKFGRLIFSLGA